VISRRTLGCYRGSWRTCSDSFLAVLIFGTSWSYFEFFIFRASVLKPNLNLTVGDIEQFSQLISFRRCEIFLFFKSVFKFPYLATCECRARFLFLLNLRLVFWLFRSLAWFCLCYVLILFCSLGSCLCFASNGI
jgi:hypothetical protein